MSKIIVIQIEITYNKILYKVLSRKSDIVSSERLWSPAFINYGVSSGIFLYDPICLSGGIAHNFNS